jgi:hypothetical protein
VFFLASLTSQWISKNILGKGPSSKKLHGKMKKVSHRKLRTKSLPEDKEEEKKGTHTSSASTPKTTQRSTARLSFDVCFPLVHASD